MPFTAASLQQLLLQQPFTEAAYDAAVAAASAAAAAAGMHPAADGMQPYACSPQPVLVPPLLCAAGCSSGCGACCGAGEVPFWQQAGGPASGAGLFVDADELGMLQQVLQGRAMMP